ncbi:MAG: flagellar basal body rod protein FlgB [Anaerovoracaceae bacterium]|jgi:flagellar basal-body rod protein FlgB
MFGDGATLAIMQKAMDGVWQRQRAVSNNIANYETPGYKAIKVDFESTLKKQIKRMNPDMSRGEIAEKIASSPVNVYTYDAFTNRLDGNNVDLDLENVEMAKMQIQYQYLARSMSDMFSRMRYAISEGKK